MSGAQLKLLFDAPAAGAETAPRRPSGGRRGSRAAGPQATATAPPVTDWPALLPDVSP